MLTPAQRRLIHVIRAYGGGDTDHNCAEYWPVVNDWLKDRGPAASFAFRNQERTVDILVRGGYVTIEDGLFRLTEKSLELFPKERG